MELMDKLPFINWVSHHPRVAGWLALSIGMVTLLVYEARDIGLLVTQWVALIVATIFVAGLCVWIISWEDSNDEDSPLEISNTMTMDAVKLTEDNNDEVSTDSDDE